MERSARRCRASIAFAVSYAFVVTKTQSGRAFCGTVVDASGFATTEVLAVMRSPCARTASTCSDRPTSTTLCRRESNPPMKLPIAPAPNTRISTRAGVSLCEKTVSVGLTNPSFFIKITECSNFLVFATFKNPLLHYIFREETSGQEEKGQEKEAIGRLPTQP